MKKHNDNEYYYSEGIVDQEDDGEFEGLDLIMPEDDEYFLNDLDDDDFDMVMIQGFKFD